MRAHVDELQDKDRLSRRGEMFAVREKKIEGVAEVRDPVLAVYGFGH